MPCDISGGALHRRDEEPSRGAFDRFLEVFGETAVSVEPCEGPFNDPPSGQDFEALYGIGSPDDFDLPCAALAERGAEFVARITAICKDMPEPWEAVADSVKHIGRTVTILDFSGVDQGVDQIALGVGEDVALASLDLLARVIASGSPRFPWS